MSTSTSPTKMVIHFAAPAAIVLSTTLTSAAPSLAPAPAPRASSGRCPDFQPVSQVFNVGPRSQEYVLDVPDDNSWDANTTKIFYFSTCEPNAVHEIAFVNLDECSPITSRYEFATQIGSDWEKCYATPYLMPVTGPIIRVDSTGSVRIRCPENDYSYYQYEVHFKGNHRDEMLAGLCFYNKTIA